MPLLLTTQEGFSRSVPNKPVTLTRLELWKSAAVVGTPAVFGAGVQRRSLVEMAWRVLMVKANLDVKSGHWVKSQSFKNLDPSEKGSVSYFLGLAQAHAMCTRLLGYSHLVHLDALVGLQGKKLKGRRSDLVGLTAASTVTPTLLSNIATVEAKGRTNDAPKALRDSAKVQATNIAALRATNVIESVASISYFEDDLWASYLVDPVWTGRRAKATVEDALRHYYSAIIDAGRESITWADRDGVARFEVPEVGLSLSLPSSLVRAYDASVAAVGAEVSALTHEYQRLVTSTGRVDDFITPALRQRQVPQVIPQEADTEPGRWRWIVSRTREGSFEFRLVDGNGEPQLTSTQFVNRESALAGLESVRATLRLDLAAGTP